MDPSTARSPSLSSSAGSRRNSLYPPLSNHGMPKTPAQLSPGVSLRRHRFSGIGVPTSPRQSEPPMSPMSPPMSAKSFGTFIDSEPSTPAYSPRMGSTWDSSTLVLLSPVSSAPTSPMEPVWEMMAPIQKPPKKTSARRRVKASLTKEIPIGIDLVADPGKRHFPESQKENQAPTEEDAEKQADKEEEAQSAPLGKLASRMKSLLRRKAGDRKSVKKRKDYYDLDRPEDAHWTEM